MSAVTALISGGHRLDHLRTRPGSLSPPDSASRAAPAADVIFLYFAGHGKTEDGDVVLVTHDGSSESPGIRFSQVLAKIQASQASQIIIILDCCFAGAAGKVPALGGGTSTLPPGVVIMTASREDQTSAETSAGRGLFSTYLEGALQGGAAEVLGKITIAGIYAYLDELFGAWDQRPMLKANVDRLEVLRTVMPSVEPAKLRELVAMFSDPYAKLDLDPSFEPTEEPRHDINERKFSVLQDCRAAKLVEPIEEQHLYFAAMRKGTCRLTALGRHYWLQVHKGHV